MIRTGPPHSDTVATRPVSDLCTCCCATSKDVSQQVVVWAQTRDRAAAMLAHAVISIGKLDAIPTDRRCDRTWSWHHHRRRRPVLGSSATRTQDALWSRASLAMVGLFVGLTQWVVLSEPDVHPWCGASRAAPGSARPAPTARFNLWRWFCPNYSYNEPVAGASGDHLGPRHDVESSL